MQFLLIIMMLFYTGHAWTGFDHSHALWDQLLKEHVKYQVDTARVDYARLHKHPEKLLAYIENIQSVQLDDYKAFSMNQKLAFWINAYNAHVWLLIIQNYPIERMDKLASVFASPFSRKSFMFLGQKKSLEDIQDKYLRKELKEPRALLALCGGYLSSAAIANEAYIASKIDQQLSNQSKYFLNNNRTAQFRSQEKVLWLSKIFKMYGADFNARYKGYERFIRRYLKVPAQVPVEWIEVDWSLNEFK